MIEILKKYKTVAVVGCSHDPRKAAHQVPRYLINHGFRIIPVNPGAQEILGERSYKSLLDLPEELKRQIEIVNIFRPSNAVMPVVDQAVTLRQQFLQPSVIWMQSGIANEAAADKARAAGMTVIMDRCIMVEHARIGCLDRSFGNST